MGKGDGEKGRGERRRRREGESDGGGMGMVTEEEGGRCDVGGGMANSCFERKEAGGGAYVRL